MNFLAHYVLATKFLNPALPRSAYAAGVALPDLLPLAAARVRLRPAQLRHSASRTDMEVALSAGVSVHLATDAAFHKAAAFAEVQVEVSRILAGTAFDGIRVRRFFVAHVLAELALDAVLLRADPSLAERFYADLAAADSGAITQWAETVTGRSLPRLPETLTRFTGAGYLRHYADDTGVATGLSHLCRRAGQDTFDGENFRQLTATVQQCVFLIDAFVPRLFSETAAKTFRMTQESCPDAANSRTMSAASNIPEQRFRIHFPLSRISTPIVTYLVTEYDLSPNLLRADIDAKNGGWLVLGLTGDTDHLHSALEWMRGQGLEVTSEA